MSGSAQFAGTSKLFVHIVKPMDGCHMRSSHIVGAGVGLTVGESVLHMSSYGQVGTPNTARQHCSRESWKYSSCIPAVSHLAGKLALLLHNLKSSDGCQRRSSQVVGAGVGLTVGGIVLQTSSCRQVGEPKTF